LNYRNFNKSFICNIQSLETRNLWDRDSEKWVSRRVSTETKSRDSITVTYTSIIKLYAVCFWICDNQRYSKASCISARNK